MMHPQIHYEIARLRQTELERGAQRQLHLADLRMQRVPLTRRLSQLMARKRSELDPLNAPQVRAPLVQSSEAPAPAQVEAQPEAA